MSTYPAESLDDPRPALEYATAYARSPRIWASAVLVAGGLGLIGLGGCFLIGVMILHLPAVMLNGSTPGIVVAWTNGVYAFAGVLYGAAFGCFAGAAVVLVLTTRSLLRAVER